MPFSEKRILCVLYRTDSDRFRFPIQHWKKRRMMNLLTVTRRRPLRREKKNRSRARGYVGDVFIQKIIEAD